MKKRQVLSIFIDGTLMRLALMSQDEAVPIVQALETTKLVEPFDVPGDLMEDSEENLAVETPAPESPFSFKSSDEESEDTLEIEGAETNFDVVMDVVSKMCPEDCSIAFNLLDSTILYKNIEQFEQKNKKKIKQEIISLFTEDRASDRSPDTVDYITRDDGSHLALLHDDPLEFLRLLGDIQRFTRRRPPRISLVDTIEIALAGAIRANYEFGEEDNTAVVLIGNSYSKVFFMKGMEIGVVLPTINEGSRSSSACETIFSKLLFELDSGNISGIDRFILVGEIDRVDAENFFQTRFQKCDVEKLHFYNLQFGEKLQDLVSEEAQYAPAIALGIKALDRSASTQYSSNIIPDKIKDQQSLYKIAWHGTVMLIILFLCVLYLSHQSAQKGQAIKLARLSLQDMNAEIDRLSNIKAQVDSMNAEINNLEESTAILDSLVKNATCWTPTVEKLSEAHEKIGGFSLLRISNATPTRLVIEAESQDREKIADLERFMSGSNLESVIRINEEGYRYLYVKMQTDIEKNHN